MLNLKRGLAVALALVTSVLVAVAPSLAQSAGFVETFGNLTPAAPLDYSNPTSWDIFVQGVDTREPSLAQHGPNCEPPGFPYTASNSHPMHTQSNAVFTCSGHVMTSPGIAGYAAVYMTPPALMDFTGGSSTLSWNMSTLRTAARDWVDVVLTPYGQHSDMAYNNNDQHVPPDNIHLTLAGTNVWLAYQQAGGSTQYTGSMGTLLDGDGSTTWDDVFARVGLQESPARRDTFQVVLSQTHISLCMPGYMIASGGVFCWVNTNLPHALDPNVWHGQASVMFGHRVYNAEKSCSADEDQYNIVHNPTGDAECPPDTWHWDDVNIQPYAPFPVIQATTANLSVNTPNPTRVDFTAPAPAGSYLSFVSFGHTPDLRVSFNGGSTWTAPHIQPANAPNNGASEENGEQIFTAIPAGTQSIMVRGSNGFWGTFEADGFVIYGPPGGTTGTAGGPTNTPTPAATSTPARTPTRTPTATAAPTNTAVPTATAPATPTVTATAFPSNTPTVAPTSTPTAVATATATNTAIPTSTPTATAITVSTCAVQALVNGTPQTFTRPAKFCTDQ